MKLTFESASTKSIDVEGTKFAYREIGEKGGIPLVMPHHLTAVLDDRDPKLVDGLAAQLAIVRSILKP